MKKTPLHFLGPKSENRPFYTEMVSLIMNDYAYWRRNFHPNDPTASSYSETKNEVNQEYQENFVNELYKLLAELKLDPPFFSPRYMAHMISETTMASQLAYIATLLYNPNNVSSEASPITIKYELEIGRQFAKLFGYDPEAAFGHLTSGGTLANYQSLYYNFNLRLLPLSIYLCSHELDIKSEISKLTLWELLNVPYEKYDELVSKHKEILEHRQFPSFQVSHLGLRSLEKKVRLIFNEELPEFKILTSSTAHYSWKRSASLLGLGQENIIKVPLNKSFEIDVGSLETILDKTYDEKSIIIQASFVYGSTEFGSFDPLKEICDQRDRILKKLYFPIHVDAAFGGYFAAMNEEQLDSHNFQSKTQAIGRTESVTVDPHKLGFCPYGAGAFIFKHGYLKRFLAASAHYCFDPQSTDAPTEDQLGKYILEGSKPGASAAAVYFNHKMISLDGNGFGRLLENLCSQAASFKNKLIQNKNSKFELIPINDHQSNIICFFVKDRSTNSLSTSNEITSELASNFGVKNIKSIQEYDYIVSSTKFYVENFKDLPDSITQLDIDTEYVQLVRMVFMNQWHEKKTAEGIVYLDDFINEMNTYLTTLPTRS
jgi:glutamate/tyrosine decarboxylase-like PLP-dependent enzyme